MHTNAFRNCTQLWSFCGSTSDRKTFPDDNTMTSTGRNLERSGIFSDLVVECGKTLEPHNMLLWTAMFLLGLAAPGLCFTSQQYFNYFYLLLALLKATLDCWNSHLFAALEVAWLAMDGKLVSKEVSEILGAMQLYKCQIQLSSRRDMNSFRNHCSVARGDAVTPL